MTPMDLDEKTQLLTADDIDAAFDAASAHVNARARVAIALNETLVTILGRPNFLCGQVARTLRAGGARIPHKSEHEQAAVIHFMLQAYLVHGDAWSAKANEALRAIYERSDAAKAPT